MVKKYYYSALAHKVQGYLPPGLFKTFMGHCYTYGYTPARLIVECVKFFFKDFPKSEIEYRNKKYDEFTISYLLNNWVELKEPGQLKPVHLRFLYEKIKYQKVMLLNISFNEMDFMFERMRKVFDCIFTSVPEAILKETIYGLPNEMQGYILQFDAEVRAIRLLKNDQ